MSDTIRCPCGATHSGPAWDAALRMVENIGETVRVSVIDGTRAWKVPRVYIAMHGLRAADLGALASRYQWEAA